MPAADGSAFGYAVFGYFAVFADSGEAVARGPPVEIGDATLAVDAAGALPLEGGGGEDVDAAASFLGGRDEANVASTRRDFEVLGCLLALFEGLERASDFVDDASGEVPDVEVAAARGEEDLG